MRFWTKCFLGLKVLRKMGLLRINFIFNISVSAVLSVDLQFPFVVQFEVKGLIFFFEIACS